MPLVDPLPQDHDPEVAELAAFYNTTLGFPPNSVLTMMRRPEIAKSFIALNRAVMEPKGKVTAEFKRLISELSSKVAGCRYCQAHMVLASSRFGATSERLADIWVYRTSPHFTEAEKAALDFAVAASQVPNAVTPEIGANLKKHWDDGDIVEIVGVVALFGYLNRWNDSMATTLEAPAEAIAGEYIAPHGWQKGKHV